MRRKLAIIAALFWALLAVGQDKEFMRKAESSLVTFDYSYSASNGFKGSGKVQVQKDCFKMEGDGLIVWSDGKTRWSVDLAAKEAIVEAVQEDSRSQSFISSFEAAFNVSAKLIFSNSKLVGAEVELLDGTKASFKISNLKFLEKLPIESFVYTLPSDKDFIVTDFR